MSNSVELMRYLAMQQACLQEIYSLMKDEEKAIVALDTERMNELNMHKDELLQRQRSLVLDGKQLTSSIALKLGLPNNSAIAQIIDRMEPKHQEELHVLHNGLTELATKVKGVANTNRVMLERFLSTVNESLAFILRVLNSSNMYGAAGTYLNHVRTGAMMVNREA